jgi:hypothetical protein
MGQPPNMADRRKLENICLSSAQIPKASNPGDEYWIDDCDNTSIILSRKLGSQMGHTRKIL